MKKYIIYYNIGYGAEYLEIEAKSLGEAQEEARKYWRAFNYLDLDCHYAVVESKEATDEMRAEYL